MLTNTIDTAIMKELRMKWVKPKIEYIGDIAIIKPPFYNKINIDYIKLLANEVIEKQKFVKSVWLATSPVKGKEKTRNFIHIAGEKRSHTIYKEHGCLFKVDIRNVFITPRLSFEHLRVAYMIRENETIINMFAGVGLFSIIIAKKSKPFLVHSIDINPHAYKLMKENIALNKVERVVIPYLGDAGNIIKEVLQNSADRVLMPLPEIALEYLGYAILSIRKIGFIHIYLHVNSKKYQDPIEVARELLANKLNGFKVSYEIRGSRIVRSVGPRLYQVVLDVFTKKH